MANEAYILVEADHVTGTAENISVHLTLAGASARLIRLATQRGMDIHEAGSPHAPADRPRASGGNGLSRSQGLEIEDIELEGVPVEPHPSHDSHDSHDSYGALFTAETGLEN